MTESVASVTFAFNAGRSLPRQLDVLSRQTHPLDEIIVVDNASTDGTAAMLAERYPHVTVLRMSENLGAAGAWAAGLRYAALEKGYDWVWTFDDDSVPQIDALETIIAGLESLGAAGQDVGLAAPMPVCRTVDAKYPPYFWRNKFVKPTAEDMKPAIWFADLAIASGLLVRGRAAREAGLPRTDFFMDVFDFEYCLRLRSKGYRLAVMGQVELSHEIGNSRQIKLPGYKRLWMSQPPWREYYISRNLIYLAWTIRPNLATKLSIGRYLAVHFVQVLLFSPEKATSALRILQGLCDGLRGKLGIRLKPGTARPPTPVTEAMTD